MKKPKYLFIVKGAVESNHIDHMRRSLEAFFKGDDDSHGMIISLPPGAELEVKVFDADEVKDLPEVKVEYVGPGPHREGTWK